MNYDLLKVLEFWEREKEIKHGTLIAAMEDALLAAAEKVAGKLRRLRAVVGPNTGDIKAFAKFLVVEEVASKGAQVSLADARNLKPDLWLGEELDVDVSPREFGLVAAAYARQALELPRVPKAKPS
jgi:N utilization substance protein A